MKRRLLSVVLLVLLTLPCEVSAQVLPFRSYSIEEGLSESVVYDILQDEGDYLWIGTNYGLNRFDGITFKQYHIEDGLKGNSVLGLFEDNHGRLWVGTEGGVNLFQEDTLTTPEPLNELNGIQVNDIFQDRQGHLWFATRGEGVWRWNEKMNNLTRILEEDGLAGNRVRTLAQDEEGVIWIATRQGLTRWEKGDIRNFTRRNGLPGNMLRDIVIDKQNRIWIGTRGGLSLFQDGRFINYTEVQGLVNDRIRSISIDPAGGLWLGTEDGLSHFKNGTFDNYEVSEGLPNEILYATLVDREGNLWLGSFGGGLIRLTGRYFRNFTMDEGLPNEVITSFAEDEAANVWIGTYGGGVALYNGSNLKLMDKHDGLVDNKVYELTRDRQNRMWIGTRWGISIYDNGRFTNYEEEEMPHRKVRDIHQSMKEDSVYWIGTYGGGLLRFRGGRFKQYTRDDGLAHNTVMDIAETDDGSLWLATYGGISRYKDGTFTNYTIEDGIPSNGILDIDKGNGDKIWFSTFEGIAYYQDGTFTSITTDQNLPATLCYFIEQDRTGKVWIGTNKGVVRFHPELFDRSTGARERVKAFKLFNKSQGLVTDEMNVGAVLESRDGSMWFGTVAGASRLLAKRQKRKPVTPKVHINDLRVAEEKVELNRNLIFESDENSLRFDYIGISYQAPELVDYEYRLKGGEERWFQTSERRVRYTALSPGDYTFQVRARNVDGLWSEQTASVHFTIQAPFWQTWWFVVIILSILAGTIIFIYRYYSMKKQMEMERMRVRIASDLHDDVGSTLTEIALQSDFLQAYDQMDPGDLRDTLQQIGNQSRKIVSSLDDIVWSIDARNDTVGDLTDRMQDYAYHVLNPNEIEVKFHFERLDMEEKIDVEKRENIYLIFKEAVNNIAKHSNADKVDIYLIEQNDGLALYVEDNGSVSNKQRKSGQGLRNMELRAQRLNALLEIDRESGFSVRVTQI